MATLTCVSRYKGTALNVSVLPAAAAALKPIMPVKVSYFLREALTFG